MELETSSAIARIALHGLLSLEMRKTGEPVSAEKHLRNWLQQEMRRCRHSIPVQRFYAELLALGIKNCLSPVIEPTLRKIRDQFEVVAGHMARLADITMEQRLANWLASMSKKGWHCEVPCADPHALAAKKERAVLASAADYRFTKDGNIAGMAVFVVVGPKADAVNAAFDCGVILFQRRGLKGGALELVAIPSNNVPGPTFIPPGWTQSCG